MKTNSLKDTYVLLSILILIILGIIAFLFRSNFTTIDADLTYHLATAESFVREGGIGLLETWDSLPLGRPHLYPPVFHILISPLLLVGFSPFAVISIFNWLGIIGLLFISWFALFKLFNSRTAFFYLLLVAGNTPFIKSIGHTLPASIVFCLSPYLILLMKRGKTLATIALLTLLFYTHMIFPWLVAGAFIIWAWFNRIYFQKVLRVVFVSFLLYLPWLFHIAGNLEFLRYFGPVYGERPLIISFNLSVVALCLLLLYILFKKWRDNIWGKDITFFVALLFVSLPIAYFEFGRFFPSIGLYCVMIIVAFSVSELHTLARSCAFAVKLRKVLLVLFSLSCVIYIFPILIGGEFRVFARHTIIWEALAQNDPYYLGYYDGHFHKINLRMAERIREITPENGVIISLAHQLDAEKYEPNRSYTLAQFFTSLSNRKMANLRSPELYFQQGLDVRHAHILLVNRDQFDKNDAFIGRPEIKIGDTFEFVAEHSEGGIMVLKNKNPLPFKAPENTFIIPLFLAIIIVFGSGAYIVYTIVRAENEVTPHPDIPKM